VPAKLLRRPAPLPRGQAVKPPWYERPGTCGWATSLKTSEKTASKNILKGKLENISQNFEC